MTPKRVVRATIRGKIWRVEFAPTGGTRGLCISADRRLVVVDALPPAQRLEVIVHEATHAFFRDLTERAVTELAEAIARHLWTIRGYRLGGVDDGLGPDWLTWTVGIEAKRLLWRGIKTAAAEQYAIDLGHLLWRCGYRRRLGDDRDAIAVPTDLDAIAEMMRETADWAAQGFAVVPLGDNGKPLLDPTKATRRKASIRKQWRENPLAGLGIPAGARHGLLALVAYKERAESAASGLLGLAGDRLASSPWRFGAGLTYTIMRAPPGAAIPPSDNLAPNLGILAEGSVIPLPPTAVGKMASPCRLQWPGAGRPDPSDIPTVPDWLWRWFLAAAEDTEE